MKTSHLFGDGGLPALVAPAAGEATGLDALLAWADRERDWLDARLHGEGAVLFRGFEVSGAEAFEHFCTHFGSRLQRYVGGNTPRSRVTGAVYTSTEYPSHLEIPLHNEMSYADRWPARLFFFCDRPATEGGETPLADGRRMLEELPGDVAERFDEKQVRYLQNLHDGSGFGMGKSWQEAFETEDRDAVEAHCDDHGIDWTWVEGGLRLVQVRQGLATHPATGERVWFNQADQWHVSVHGARRAATLLARLGREGLPRHATFGDGSPISEQDLQAVRDAQRRVEVTFPWQSDDLLVLDNVLTAHARRPFNGPRRILAGLA